MKGYTLVELLIVLAIVGILSALVVNSFKESHPGEIDTAAWSDSKA